MQRKLENFRIQIEQTRSVSKSKDTIDAIVDSAKQFLTPLQLSLFRAQMIANQRKSKGMRWSVKDKLFGLQLMYKSASAYHFVSKHFKLPSTSTLRKFVTGALGRLESGFTDVVFSLLRLRLQHLPLRDRQCALVFDEMSVKSDLVYDKNVDKILGYTDEGQIGTHAVVFMIRGLSVKWKQAIGFFLLTIQSELINWPHWLKNA